MREGTANIADTSDATRGPTTIGSDRNYFFSFVFNNQLSLEQLLNAYLAYHGPMFNDQRTHLLARLAKELKQRGIELSDDQILDVDQTLKLDNVREFIPALQQHCYYVQSTAETHRVEILPASQNELIDLSLPKPLNRCMHRSNRPSFLALQVPKGRSLFIGPNQYQLFDRHSGQMFKEVCSRPFGRTIEQYDRIKVDEPVFLI